MGGDVVTTIAALGVGIVAALLGWPLTRLVLRVAGGRDRARAAHAEADVAEDCAVAEEAVAEDVETVGRPTVADEVEPAADVDDDGLLRGGLWIGLLERGFVAGGIALGEPSILAVVVAIKGLGRVPELLRSPTAGERFIIGSLASLGVALAIGVIGRALVG
ncbi:MAG: hypothetical protein ACTHVY_00930 [Brevibacterium yomogidense]|nr:MULTISPECIES: hypothetical protein [Brevibacterium]SLM99637.1 hypothetical protein FM105_11520 [Brevibacterium yomogidense]